MKQAAVHLGMMISALFIAGEAAAAAAVAFGERTNIVVTDANLAQAERDALTSCNARDRNCRILVKCAGRGYGAVYASKINGYIDAIGASCGRASSEEAREVALKLCQQSEHYAKCQSVSGWVE